MKKEVCLHSFLITGASAQKNYQAALKLASRFLETPAIPGKVPDLFFLEPESDSASLKISQVRQLKKDLVAKPLAQPVKVVLVQQAHQLTPAAQNALLKTLEEPPGKTKIIVTSTQPNLLLETIVSRCQLVAEKTGLKLTDKDLAKAEKAALTISQLKMSHRLSWAEEQNFNRSELSNFLKIQLIYWHQQLIKSSPWEPIQVFSALQSLQEAIKLSKTQVNHQLILDQLLIAFPGPRAE